MYRATRARGARGSAAAALARRVSCRIVSSLRASCSVSAAASGRQREGPSVSVRVMCMCGDIKGDFSRVQLIALTVLLRPGRLDGGKLVGKHT